MIDTIEYKVKLGKIAEFRNGLNYTKKDSGTGLKVIGVSDFQDNFYPDYSSLEEVNPEDISISDEQILKENDILFVRSNGNRDLIGRSLLIKDLTEKVSHSGFTIRLRFNKDDINPNYFLYVFKSHQFRKHLANYGGGTNISNINQQILNSIEVPCPDLETQNQIVSTLSAFDELIENNTRRIEILEEMARRIYREWFVHFRYPGHEDDKLVDSGTDLGNIPEGWEVKKFGELVEYLRDRVKNEEIEEGIPVLGLGDMPKKSIILSRWENTDDIGSTKLRFKKNDILFGKIRPYFHKVGFAQTNGVCSSDIFVWRPHENKDYVLALLTASSVKFVETATNSSSGTKMPRAKWGVLEKYLIAYPPEDLLERLNSSVGSSLKQLRTISFQNKKLKETRDLLLPKLISGKVDVEKVPS